MLRISISVFVGIFLYLLTFSPISFATTPDLPQVLIINQVRGEECCATGTLASLRMQIDEHRKNNVPGYFVLRYDSLQNTEYVEYLKKVADQYPDLIKLGLLLEIIPSLTEDAGVQYAAPDDAWFEAQYVYSIGYTNEENKKMMDVLFKKFYHEFGYYPDLTSAWMIKTETLNYIHSTYEVAVHQITKEQFGTDSYTLYGGPAHYPYPASQKWSFIPDYDVQNGPLIVRQTITDPVFNYGNKAAYTSQPNDYAADGKTFTYFKNLINQALFDQPQHGFALLGLETSMDEKHQKEFINQISYVGKLFTENKISFPDAVELSSYWQTKPYSVYQGKNLIDNDLDTAYWITTPRYRLRLRISDNTLSITDIRYFDPDYTDPYQSQIAQKDGFWVVPYLLDGSESENKNTKIAYSRRNDAEKPMSYIQLPPIKTNEKFSIQQNKEDITFSYTDNADQHRTILFQKDMIEFPSFTLDEITAHDQRSPNYPIKLSKDANGFAFSWVTNDKKFVAMRNECTNQDCRMSFSSDPSLLDAVREIDYVHLLPEPDYRKLSSANTDIYINNQFAVAGRNPVRLVIDPKDEYGVPSQLPIKVIQVKTEKDISYSFVSHENLFFIDFTSENPQRATVEISLPDNISYSKNVYFAPNCKTNLSACLKNPIHAVWYFRSYIGDKMRIMSDKIQTVFKSN